jgi:ATP-binding cassette subfamily A (ABC1) protein 3
MYKDQIFVLLGHNGAGKTTTLNMLTGFGSIHPDEGEVQAFGIDLFKDKARAQKITGICPQHDALIFNMTVEENLFWFLGMRGMSNEEVLDYAK